MILSDLDIRALASNNGMIEPFVERQSTKEMVSYGLSSFGYHARVADEGVCQFLFFKGTQPCEVSYKNRNRKYMNQTGVTLPNVTGL